MVGIALVTKGMIAPVRTGDIIMGSGSGGAGLGRQNEELIKPKIIVNDVIIEGNNKKPITEETFKVKSLKIIVDQKD